MRACTNGDETDTFDRKARRAAKHRAGDCKAVKARASRRERRQSREALRTGRDA
jgi:hypothetical protein